MITITVTIMVLFIMIVYCNKFAGPLAQGVLDPAFNIGVVGVVLNVPYIGDKIDFSLSPL